MPTDPIPTSSRTAPPTGRIAARGVASWPGRPPLGVVVVAALAACFHIAPFLRAERATPPGWTFADNMTVSPDMMQYRVWARQAAGRGPLVDDRFTSEPNRPHLFVVTYWAVGTTARVLGTTPERVYAYAGVPLAFLLVLLLYRIVRHFVPDAHAAWWTFLALVAGGGFGAHLKLVNELPGARDHPLLRRLVAEPLARTPLFEDYRSHYVVKVLLDTHFLVIWIAALASVLAFYAAVRRGGPRRTIGAASLFAASTLLHLYEGITLLAIAAGIVACTWPLAAHRRHALHALAAVTLATGAAYAVQVRWFLRSGIPLPAWRAVDVLFATLVLAYPVAFALIARGWRDTWRDAPLPARVLAGWALGCLVVTLSAPFYPYPDRGTMTLQVPLTVLGGMAYFARHSRLTRAALVVGVLTLGATPAWLLARTWRNTGFRADAPWAFQHEGHRAVLAALQARATADDVLLADGPDALWLAPTFPGRHYVAHFFLTVDYARKQAELERLLASAAPADARLLAAHRIRWFFVNEARGPARFAALPGLVPVVRSRAGWLFEVRPAGTP